MRDGRHLHRHVVGFECDVTIALAKRRFGLQRCGIDKPFDHDLSVRRHLQIIGHALGHAYRLARKCARHGHLIQIHRQLLRRGKKHHGCRAQHNGDRHFQFAFTILEPMYPAARTTHARHHAHHATIGGLQGRAIGTHVLYAIVRVARHAHGGGEIRRGIKPRCGYRYG